MMIRLSTTLSLLLFVGFGAASGRAAQPDGILRLTDGGYLPGRVLESTAPDALRWESRLFTRSLTFPLTGVDSVTYPSPQERPKPDGDYCFELTGDDVVYGNLVALDENTVTIENRRAGRVHLRRDAVRRFFRWQGAELIYLGPDGLIGWKDSSAGTKWTNDGGRPKTTERGASLYGDFKLPKQVAIEFQLSWKDADSTNKSDPPDFLLALGVENELQAAQQAFRFEVWDGTIVAVGESDQDSDVAFIRPIDAKTNSLRVQAYIDQPKQTMLVYSHQGEKLAELGVSAKKPHMGPGILLLNKRGQIRLDSLRISRWDGTSPLSVKTENSRLHLAGGEIVYNDIVGYDGTRKELTVKQGDRTKAIPLDTITDAFLSQKTEATGTETPNEPRLRLVYHDGTKLSGSVRRIDANAITLELSSATDTVELPLESARSLQVLTKTSAAANPKPTDKSRRRGTLKAADVSLAGYLVDGKQEGESSCLVWQPASATDGAPLRGNMSGRIVYRQPAPRITVPVQQPANMQQLPRAVGGRVQPAQIPGFGAVFKRIFKERIAQPPVAVSRAPSVMHLRTGDTVPCFVSRIDETGVHFSSPVTEATFLAHKDVQAIEFVQGVTPSPLEDRLRERLLTLPRVLRNSPPTHLLIATNGDYLRGRVTGLEGEMFSIEIRLEDRRVPQDRVAKLIWLHPEALKGDEAAAEASVAADARRVQVQAIQPGEKRFTFDAEQFADGSLKGHSLILGQSQVQIDDIDQLLINEDIAIDASRLAFHQWKLQHATDPRYITEDGSSPPVTGTESSLVGKEAPDFSLDLLAGGRFTLGEQRGKIIVLDFWATWCGPCIQTMPIVESVVGEFDPDRVQLIAVNMEEQPDLIKAMMERHEFDMTVALDRDGVAAARYQVTAIPQTVIIDADGKISRLFVGGGPKLEAPFREALQELTGTAPKADESDGAEAGAAAAGSE